MDKEDGVLVIRAIRVTYRLKLAPEHVDIAHRAHEMHHPFCPVYRTVSGCIDIETRLVVEEA